MDELRRIWKRELVILLIIAFAFGMISTPFSAEAISGDTYYVAPNGNDNNPGTLEEPWLTLQKAADIMVAGDTTYVRSGTYDRVNLKRSGSPGQYITFQAYPGEHPILDGGSWAGFVDQYADTSPLEYFIIDGFEIMNFEHGINLIQSNHFILRNNRIHNNSVMGISVDNGQNGEITNNIVYQNGGYDGILIARSRNIDIHHNVAYSNFMNGIAINSSSHDNLIHHNIAYDNSCGWDQRYAGIAIEVDSENNMVFNNLSYNNCHGGYITNSPNNEIYNNVFYGNKDSQILLGDWNGSKPINNVFMNNIFFVTRSSDRAVGYFYSGTSYNPLKNTYDHNLYYYVNGPDKSNMIANLPEDCSFLEWQALGKEQNGVLGNPQFISPSNADFHLRSNSPAIDAGADVGVIDDFDGNPRPQGAATDIGAFEYLSVGPTSTPIPSPTSSPVSPTPTHSPTIVPPSPTLVPSSTTLQSTPTLASSSTPEITNTPTIEASPTLISSITPTSTRTLMPSKTPSSTPLPADINQDGRVDVLDTQLCVNVVLGTETDPVIVARADVNTDGEVNVLDVQEIVNVMLAI
jgi:parallel beta-helix repeat protein